MLQTETVFVTPEQASEWLKKNIKNRPLRPDVVSRYTRDMTRGEWQETGEAVKFSPEGTLLDGQHRLSAVIEAGIPVPLMVVRNVQEQAREVMDSGAKRTAADALQFAGHKNSAHKASLASLAASIHLDEPTKIHSKSANLTHPEVIEWVETTDGVEDAVNFSAQYARGLNVVHSIAAYCALRLYEVGGDEGLEFLRSVAEHRTEGVGDPRLALIHALGSTSVQTQKGRGRNMLSVALIFRAWNAVVSGKEMKMLKAAYIDTIPVPLSLA